ncbi:MAG: glycosyltransferase family 2 protein [Myxococcales bacterium]|nr:glycosyltransferase family 2 protein [Myxococcales bacterium]
MLPAQPRSYPTLSVLVPVHDEEANLLPFVDELATMLDEASERWELVFVDDGSRDASLAMLAALAASRRNIKVVSLARHFGKEAAISAGLRACAGQAAILMDCDLQHPPAVVLDMLARWRRGAHLVVGIRQWRADQSRLRIWLTARFYGVMRRLANIDLAANAADFRLIDRALIDVINALPERTRFLKGLFQWPGFRCEEVPFTMRPRQHGQSRWSLGSLWRLALDGIVSFSSAPLKIWTYVGAMMALLAIGGAAVAGVQYLAWQATFTGGFWAAMGGLLACGVVLISQGIQGEYLARIYDEVRGRPLYVVQSLHGFSSDDAFAAAHGVLQTQACQTSLSH